MKNIISVILLTVAISSCTSKEQDIINQNIKAHGGDSFENINTEFDFRGIHYHFLRENGSYRYQRTQTDSLENETIDVLTNDGLIRSLDEVKISIPDSMAVKYSNSVNSVAYFFLLPYGLNDDAVHKEYIKELSIKGENYHQLKVWFAEEGGGVDHQDIFMFWINAETNLLDYLAYSYETDGGGVRFREAFNRRKVGEFTFQDYRNYGYEDQYFPLDDLPTVFENGELPLLSSIENENVTLVK